MNMDGALKDVTAWYAKNRRFMNEADLGKIVAKHTNNDEEAARLVHFLASDVGKRWLTVHLQRTKEEMEAKSQEPRFDVDFAQRLQHELTKELREPFGGLLAYGRFPKRDEAIQKLGKVTVAEVHDNGGLTVRSAGKLYLVTAQGETIEQTASYLKEKATARVIDAASSAGASAVSALPLGPILGASIRRSGEIAKERIAEKKGVPWQMAAFGPLGSFLVPRKSYLRESGTEHTGRIYLREGERQPPDVEIKIGPRGMRYYEISVGDEELTGSSHGQKDLQLTAYCGGRVCGVIYYAVSGDVLWVKYIRVDPPYRRKGVASALFNKAKALNPGSKVELTTMTPEGYELFSALGAVPKSYLKERIPQGIPRERVLPFAEYSSGTARWSGIFDGKKITVTITGLVASHQNLASSRAIVSSPASHDDIAFSGAGAGDAWWQASTRERSFVVQVTGLAMTPRFIESMFGNSVASIEVRDDKSYLVETDSETCEMLAPQYWDLLPLLNSVPMSYSLLVEPEAKGRKIDEILKRLKEGVESISSSANFHDFLLTMAKFHDYSIGNQILIMLQSPSATRVAGYGDWKSRFGRQVKYGEKGIAILAPCMPPKRKVETEEGEEQELQPRPMYFKVVYVFDISQTEGKPLPEFEVPSLTGEANEELFAKVLAHDKGEGLDVSFASQPDQNPEIKGYYVGKKIWVRPEESRAEQLKTLIHETAHYYTEGVFMIPRADAETIAESVAFTVGAHYGFDSGARSFPYVAIWAQDKKVLDRNLLNIRKIAGRIIEALE
jgi:GNAT superfamily N-acetyltransferase